MPLPALNMIGMVTKHWKLIAAAGALFVMYLYWADRTSQIEELRAKNDNLRAEIVLKDAQYAENERRFRTEIADQNEKIKQAGDEFVRLQRDSEVLIEKENARNEQRVTQLEQQLSLLKNIPTPQTCTESIDLLVDIGVANPWPTKSK